MVKQFCPITPKLKVLANVCYLEPCATTVATNVFFVYDEGSVPEISLGDSEKRTVAKPRRR